MGAIGLRFVEAETILCWHETRGVHDVYYSLRSASEPVWILTTTNGGAFFCFFVLLFLPVAFRAFSFSNSSPTYRTVYVSTTLSHNAF